MSGRYCKHSPSKDYTVNYNKHILSGYNLPVCTKPRVLPAAANSKFLKRKWSRDTSLFIICQLFASKARTRRNTTQQIKG